MDLLSAPTLLPSVRSIRMLHMQRITMIMATPQREVKTANRLLQRAEMDKVHAEELISFRPTSRVSARLGTIFGYDGGSIKTQARFFLRKAINKCSMKNSLLPRHFATILFVYR